MGTSFDLIEDRFLAEVDDYKITALYNRCAEMSSTEEPSRLDVGWEEWYAYLDSFMALAVGRFTQSKTSLAYASGFFVENLSQMEQNILLDYIVIEWFKRETNNSAAISLKLKVASGFTYSSESATMKAKMNYLHGLEEEVSRKVTEYLLQFEFE